MAHSVSRRHQRPERTECRAVGPQHHNEVQELPAPRPALYQLAPSPTPDRLLGNRSAAIAMLRSLLQQKEHAGV